MLSGNLELTKCLLRAWEFVNGFTKQRFKWPGSFAERHPAYLAEKDVSSKLYFLRLRNMKCPACNKKLKFNKKKRMPYLSVEFFKSLIYVFGTEDSATCSQCAVKLVGIKSSRVAMRLGFQILTFTSIIYITTFFLYRQFINIVGAIVIPCYVLAILLFLYSLVKLKNIKVSSEGCTEKGV